MTNSQHDKLADLARLLGWFDIFEEPECDGLSGFRNDVSGREIIPNYYTDLNAAHELGEEMERRGLRYNWCQQIRKLVVFDRVEHDATFCLLQATAAQRARAALEVLLKAEQEAKR
jgi:hypothetical protein